ncbi:unnamed protein product [Blepharisma stoltei]|uniref:Uncharacterized protein n=1 Tax=Blepharisma stoltei TaxID=1481888 RepID=A0AAU9JSP9_9CILI|nr:unnamed protein product [Blepharisma stoltei]
MIDSSGNNYKMPGLLKFLLKTQISYEKSERNTDTFGGLFPSAIIYDKLSSKQHENCSQSWIWLIFNTLMLISTGNCNYLREFSNFDEKWINKILAIFEDLNINFSLEQKSENLWFNLDFKWVTTIEKAILNELYAKLSSWPILQDQVKFLPNNLNISQLCALSEYQDNNKVGDALQFIDSLKQSKESDPYQFNTPTSIRLYENESSPTYHSVIKVKKILSSALRIQILSK